MFKKFTLNKRIRLIQTEIDVCERKRSRSLAAIVQAIMMNAVPDDNDVEYFSRYTSQIEERREEIQKIKEEITKL